jgi:Glycosyl transferases group 1
MSIVLAAALAATLARHGSVGLFAVCIGSSLVVIYAVAIILAKYKEAPFSRIQRARWRWLVRAPTPRVVVIGSLGADEPLEAILATAAAMPDVHFVLTGNPRHAARPEVLAVLPANVELAGWLAFEDYLGLVRSADVALALTTRDLTLLRGAWEAVYLGLPLVTSHWPALRACFGRGTTHVDNDAAAIGAGVRTALRQADALRAEMHQLGVDKRRAWDEALATRRALLVLPSPATRGE